MQTDWTKLQSQAIDLLRFPMAVAVVMLHYSTTVIIGATGVFHAICVIFQVGICLTLLFVMQRLLPRTTNLLTGNRGL